MVNLAQEKRPKMAEFYFANQRLPSPNNHYYIK